MAWDPVRQEEVWRVTQSNIHNGGILSTAGNLVFQGNTDEELAAYNAENGDRLWSMDTQTAIIAPPISYSIDGEQYIAVVAGWGSVTALIQGPTVNPDGTKRNISRVLAFKLDGTHQLPEKPPLPERPAPPEDFGDDIMVDAGAALYRRNCGGCHGIDAVGGGILPDLRFTPVIADTSAFRSVLIDGALSDRGMISFAEIMNADDAEDIRAYLVRRAHESIE